MSHEDIDIYYISFIVIKKFRDYENSHSVNPLYLIIHSAIGHFKGKYREKYLFIDSIEEYKEVWSGIKSKLLKHLMVENNCFIKKFATIGINKDDDLPLNKQLTFPALTIIIRCDLQKNEKLYPQIYLDECLYELV